MKWFLAILPLLALAGCQTPRTSYTNGLIVWGSTSAIGIGWGEYMEVPAGGYLERAITNRCEKVFGENTTSRITIDNQDVKNDLSD
jgi:hypothetical protein